MTDLQTRAWLDQQDARVAEMVSRYGQYIAYISGGRRGIPLSFAYTVGLHGVGHPELVVLSVSPSTAAGLLNELGDRIRSGHSLEVGEVLAFESWSHRVAVERLPNPEKVLFLANRHYRRPDARSVPAYQLTYDDLGGRFPWEDGYANGPHVQPRPGTWRA